MRDEYNDSGKEGEEPIISDLPGIDTLFGVNSSVAWLFVSTFPSQVDHSEDEEKVQ